MTSASLIHEEGHPKLVLWDNLGEGDGVDGKRVQDGGDTNLPMAGSYWYMAKKHHNIVE